MTAQLRLVATERDLAAVLAEIAQAGPIVWDSGPKWNALTFVQKGAALDRLDDLQAKARTMIEAATGAKWSDILKGCL